MLGEDLWPRGHLRCGPHGLGSRRTARRRLLRRRKAAWLVSFACCFPAQRTVDFSDCDGKDGLVMVVGDNVAEPGLRRADINDCDGKAGLTVVAGVTVAEPVLRRADCNDCDGKDWLAMAVGVTGAAHGLRREDLNDLNGNLFVACGATAFLADSATVYPPCDLPSSSVLHGATAQCVASAGINTAFVSPSVSEEVLVFGDDGDSSGSSSDEGSRLASGESVGLSAGMGAVLDAVVVCGGVHGWVLLAEVRELVHCSEQELHDAVASWCKLGVLAQRGNAVMMNNLEMAAACFDQEA